VALALHFWTTTSLLGKRHFSYSPSKHVPRNQASKGKERKRRASFPEGLSVKPKQKIREELEISDNRNKRSTIQFCQCHRQDGNYRPVSSGFHV